jgi:hypothetical protein
MPGKLAVERRQPLVDLAQHAALTTRPLAAATPLALPTISHGHHNSSSRDIIQQV